ncbi:hypothetical protein A2625_04335 [candidate division WOR-1 bacterium RIFCSPHIGHO2_01_FULL_53_15]|uniref:DUF5615 domain-containing protein n=1 Tax=candidate division WOR-1 bacterium RIFCSPHIGHO2_01_FULL_53_15 TaxID=1802564 RepID=A0A1F4Q4L3_UNCSA|nr:MAG: hypothetical protein A2625_04335 [candidate division WOR-1 bacterium RIFCSPHIGHO2_01_FULL_53_15]
MVKFLVDANLPYSSKMLLKKLGFDAVHVRDVKLNTASDEKIFRYAQRQGRIILTRDLDFAAAIKFRPGKHQGIIVMRISYLMTAQQINGILEDFMRNVSRAKLKKSLVILEIGRYRLRRD